jgi:hypothetical protein
VLLLEISPYFDLVIYARVLIAQVQEKGRHSRFNYDTETDESGFDVSKDTFVKM